MDFLVRLDTLMEEKGINKSILSKESGVPYTTIDGFYKRGFENTKLSTIKKLCRYFDVTIDYMTGSEEEIDDTDNITAEEKRIIKAYRQADNISRAMVLRSLGLTEKPEND